MLLPFQVEIPEAIAYERETPVLVYALILVCTVIHIIVSFHLPLTQRLDLYYEFGATRFQFRWWSLITCAFLHGGWLHLGGNMFFLFVYGRHVERFLGSWRFAGLYLLGTVVSTGVHLLTVAPLAADEPAIGASGAISAVLGAFLIFWPTARMRCLFFSIISFRPLVLTVPAYIVLGFWFVGQLLYSLKIVGNVDQVAFWAHISGFVFGAGVGTVLQYLRAAAIRELEQATRAPWAEAWQAFLHGNTATAAEQCETLDEHRVTDPHGSCLLLKGLIAAENRRTGKGTDDCEILLRAFSRARDYRETAAALTAYLQILDNVPPGKIPADVHKDAGFAFVSHRCRIDALCAFRRALEAGWNMNLERIHTTVQRCVGREPGLGDG